VWRDLWRAAVALRRAAGRVLVAPSERNLDALADAVAALDRAVDDERARLERDGADTEPHPPAAGED
jgi:hypothetical protein